MKKMIAIATCLLCLSPLAYCGDKISVELVWDRSGSMGDKLKDSNGGYSTKSIIAKDAFIKIVETLNSFQKQNPDVELKWGVVTFKGGASNLLPLDKFDNKRAISVCNVLPSPDGGTPLGEAIQEAYKQLAGEKDAKCHIFILTDGLQNGNVDMNRVLKENRGKAQSYFVAFNISADTFNEAKDQGALVYEANDGKQLMANVQLIFSKKILLEREE